MKKRSFDRINSMEKLPLEIITANIFSRLPVEIHLYCREVCKTWRDLVPKPKMGLLYSVSSRKTESYIEAQFYSSEQNSDEVTKLDHSLIMSSLFSKTFMVGSCNGLVCYAGREYSKTSLYVCNPVTGDKRELSITTRSPVNIGFGYVRSSNEYKVVSIDSVYNKYTGEGVAKVYTLRGGSGSILREVIIRKSVMLQLSNLAPPVFAGRALYWMDFCSSDPKVVAFDLEYEIFKWLPSIPSVVRSADSVRLIELDGILCALEVVTCEYVTIWELRKKKSVKYWLEKFSIAWEDYSWFEQPFALTDREKCLLWYNVILSCYDPETNTMRNPDGILKKVLKDNFTKEIFTTTRAIPHVNSLALL